MEHILTHQEINQIKSENDKYYKELYKLYDQINQIKTKIEENKECLLKYCEHNKDREPGSSYYYCRKCELNLFNLF